MRLAITWLLFAALAVTAARAQPYIRSVRGTVTGPDGKPAHGAVVEITNLKTLQIRSFISKENGAYYFHGLSTRVTYELKAKYHGRTSSTQTLSKFNTDNPAVVNLKIE